MNFLFFLLVALAYFAFSIQEIIYSKKNINKSWEKLYSQLIRRCNVIPDLIDIIRKYTHEEEDIEEIFNDMIYVINFYTQYKTLTEVIRINSDFVLFFKKIFALTEKYTSLKSDVAFSRAISEISRIEDRIENARQVYNNSVFKYNKTISMFPNNHVASLFKLSPKRFFPSDECQRTVPK